MSVTLAGLTPIDITKLYLFGTRNVPADLNDRILGPASEIHQRSEVWHLVSPPRESV